MSRLRAHDTIPLHTVRVCESIGRKKGGSATVTQNLAGRRVAIIGGAGFIGHHLALHLRRLGADPHVVDGLQVNSLGYYTSGYVHDPRAESYIHFINERLRLLRAVEIPLHIIDARDYALVSNTISTIEPDAVVHLAAIAHANRSNKDPFSTFDHSMRTLENVLDSVRDRGIQVIFFSSSMVYGDFHGNAVQEDAPCNPKGIYGALKYGAEKLVEAYGQVFDSPFTIIRPSALYGERCVSRRVGQAFIENAISGQDLTVNGDGSDALDFTYVLDLVQGVTRALGNPRAFGETFNVTYGEGRTLTDLAELVLNRFPGLQLTYSPRDVLMPERGTLDISKAREVLGYDPEYPIERGIPQYMSWYESSDEIKRLLSRSR